MATWRPGKPHPMQGQAGPFAGCPPRSRSAAQMDGCSTTESGLSACYGKAPQTRGFSIGCARCCRGASDAGGLRLARAALDRTAAGGLGLGQLAVDVVPVEVAEERLDV